MEQRKTSEWVALVCGYIPFSYTLIVFALVLVARLKYGRWPIYGLSPDPVSSFTDWVTLPTFCLFLLCLLVVPIWIVMVLYGLNYYGRGFKLNRLSNIFFITGIAIYITMEYTGWMEWYLD